MRVNVYLPDELAESVRGALPGVNVSAVLQESLRRLLNCAHHDLVCRDCAQPIERHEVTRDALDRFYRELVDRLEPLVYRVGTAEGAVKVARDVARRHGIDYAVWHTLPRPSRGERQLALDVAFESEAS